MTEEALRMVVLEWLQTIWTPEIQANRDRNQRLIRVFDELGVREFTKFLPVPDSAQAHLFTGKLSRSLYAVILSLSLQIHIQTDTQACNLIGQELVSWTGSLQFIFEHVHLTLHGLEKVKGESVRAR